MAEAFPSPILDSILKQLNSPLFQRNKFNCGLGSQLRDLRSKLELIGTVIYDAQLMGILFPKFFHEWLCDLQCILHEVDDLFDEAFTRSNPQSGIPGKVLIHLENMRFDLTLAHKMKNFNERLESVVKECYKCNLLVIEPGQQPQPIVRKGIVHYDPSCARNGEFHMIGRDNDKKAVIQLYLFEEDPSMPIVWVKGPKGVGKTTLCEAIYNDEAVCKHFEVRLWFCPEAAKEFSAIDVWKKIITKLDEVQPCLETEGQDQLIDKAVSLIGMRKTLLVLDHLPYGGPFSRETTNIAGKLTKVSEAGLLDIKILWPSEKFYYHEDPDCHELQNDLSEEQSWAIFRNTALVPGHDSEEWIENLGRQIARRCLGNPALLRGVGTLLHGKESIDDMATWEYFACEFDFSCQYDHYSKIDLVYCLFQIFHRSLPYVWLFSNGEVKFEALMSQFAANGFPYLSDKLRKTIKDYLLKPIDKNDDWDDRDKYEIANEGRRDDLMRLAGTDSTIIGWRQNDLPKTSRHVSISRPLSSTHQRWNSIVLTESLIKDEVHKRSLLFLGKWHPIKMSVQTLDRLTCNLRYLRVLDLQDLALKELPSSIGKLIHLRYLDVSRNEFKELPRSICKLRNLQTLLMVYCDKLIKLPGRIKNLCHLKHLEINMCLDLTYMPSKIATLTSLQRLDRYVVSPHRGGLRYMEHLDNLSGRLTIELPQQWEKSVEDAEKANLERKKEITGVEFKWQGTGNCDEDNGGYEVLEKLKPCSSIESLFIGNFGGRKLPSWIVALVNLTELTISHSKQFTTFPPFHRFPKLKYLTLTSMMNIEYLQDNNYDGGLFLSLRELRIGCMPELKGWSSDSHGLPESIEAEFVEVWKCPHLNVMPPFCRIDDEMGHVILHDICKEMLQSFDWRYHDVVEIISIKDMVSLPINLIKHFPYTLIIKDCNQLQTFWANEVDQPRLLISLSNSFQRLAFLSIESCRELKHLSGGLSNLTGLSRLKIYRCSEELDCLHEEDGMPWKVLQKLNYLEIEGFENWEAIPKGFRHLPSQVGLTIVNCKSLKTGVDSLPKLRPLRIKACPSFVEELKREHPNVNMIGEEVDTEWPPTVRLPVEEASTSKSSL